jgi:uncharacterized membrane protein
LSETTIQRVGAALALVGIGIATYITIADAGGGAPACIAGGHGCQTVADSSYADMGGVAVSVIGIVGYVTLLVSMLWPGDAGRFAAASLSLIGFGFSIYLTYLELAVIDAVCQWCVASAVVITAIFALSVYRLIRFTGAELAAQGRGG